MFIESKTIFVIGAGFSGLACAALLGKAGHNVIVLEKNAAAGGRCSVLKSNGFVFDKGPSWYWMPDVFEQFFNRFEKSTSDFYELIRLDPAYRVYFSENKMDLPANLEGIYAVFENTEKGAGQKLKHFLEKAKYNYEIGMGEFAYKPSHSVREYLSAKLLKETFKLSVLRPITQLIRKNFKSVELRQILEFPVLFLGAKPEKTPALYSLMNYADMVLGTWYPKGGMFKITEALENLGKMNGVTYKYECEVKKIIAEKNKVIGVNANGKFLACDGIIAAADYKHVESLLELQYRNYTPNYWKKRTLAPSCILYYLGINKKLKNLLHHNLFFDHSFEAHSTAIYDTHAWPANPLFYVCAPSVSDKTVAPEGYENLFVLIPVSCEIADTEIIRENYYDEVMNRLEKHTGQAIRENVVFKKSYARSNFIDEYNSFKGNAYGLANTLRQTAFLKPKIKNKKLKNMFYAGQMTVPGPGMPPALISGQIAATEMMKYFS